MKNLRYLALSALLIGGLYSCKKDAVRESEQDKPSTEIPEVPVDFSKYVAIGNSLTFGYADGAAYKEAQESSYPLILSKSLDTEMKQALLNDGGGTGYMYLKGFDSSTKLPIIDKAAPSDGLKTKFTDPINNLGIPGIRAVDMGLPGYGGANPYMGRLLDASKVASTKYVDIVGDALSDATFATFWLGNNDVLGYASTGGAFGEMGDPSSPAYRMSGLPESSVFTLNYKYMTDLLVNKRAIIANIPPIQAAPFFTTVGPQVYKGIVLDHKNPYRLDENAATLLNKIYELAGYTPAGEQIFIAGQNFPVFIVGPTGSKEVRQMDIDGKDGDDFVLLTFSEKIKDMKTMGYGFVNIFDYPNEMEFMKQGALLKVIGEGIDGIAPLDVLVTSLKKLSSLGLGGFTLDKAVSLSGGKFTQEQADEIKAGLKKLGLTDDQIAVMTIDQIIGVVDKAPEAIHPLLLAIGLDQATIDKMDVADTRNALKKAKDATLIKLGQAAAGAGLDPLDPTSAITASKRLANPIDTKWVLDMDEAKLVEDKTLELNAFIKQVAESNPNWIFLDAYNIMMKDILGGGNEYGFTADYIVGNFFSLDGIHLTPKGYAYIARKMARRINDKWDQNLTLPDPKDYRGIKMGE